MGELTNVHGDVPLSSFQAVPSGEVEVSST